MNERGTDMAPDEAFINATKFRAKAYYYLFEEFSEAIGIEETKKIFSRAIFKLGIDKANSFSDKAGASAKSLADDFTGDEVGREVFEQSVVSSDNERTLVEMRNCPLVEMWREMNLSDEKIKLLCDMACQIDFGTVEGKGMKLKFNSRISYGDSSCILEMKE
jgi:hypothetical protein